jgi:hypothetical protein
MAQAAQGEQVDPHVEPPAAAHVFVQNVVRVALAEPLAPLATPQASEVVQDQFVLDLHGVSLVAGVDGGMRQFLHR